MSSYKTLSYSALDGIGTITLNRPEVKNALNEPMHEELYDALQVARSDENVRVIVLTGTDGAFSSGADLKSIPVEKLEYFDHGEYLERTYNPLVKLLDAINKPTVAYMNGTAAGAGLSIALACDFRVAEHDAKLALSFMKIGLVPDAGASYFLPRLVGLSKALELSLGDPISAEEAFRIGLIHRIGGPEDLISTLKKVPLTAYSSMKNNMKCGLHLSLDDVLEEEKKGQQQAGKSDEHRQALLHFLEKRGQKG
ncbi:enoyl-CoA hydratase/isomerase family protein [Alteribacter natronophilus]|uniref:enoyl-CoA hydratase/isomerase family protein n=1 Tax=Alteribacter natronophilus TaxID=2583810 RepID=UPI00110D5985|nr:enoyl-CoA hydratase-related protein [Alteribacter natronophilus]TMW72114.1 enoyl-CoA hydratase/isomerase family protein [Alteribacter natronophilus]